MPFQQSTDGLQFLLDIQQAITSHLDHQVVLQRIAAAARELTDSQRAVVFLLEGDELRIVAASGDDQAATMAGYRMPVAGSLIGLALESGEPVHIADASNNPHVLADPRRRALVERTGVQTLLIVPLLTDDQAIGAISLSDKVSGTYTEADQHLLMLLASSAAIALENARLYESEHKRRQIAESLRETLSLLNVNQPLSAILTFIVNQVSSFTGAAACIYRLDAEQNCAELLASAGLPDKLRIDIPDLRLRAIQTALEGQPSFVADIQISLAKSENQDPVPAANPWREAFVQHFNGFITVPLMIQGDVFGVLALYYIESRAKFSDDEINLSMVAGEQAALAIENSRLRQQVKQAAITEERSRLARELHDSVTQSLYSLTLFAEATRHMLHDTGGETIEHVTRIKTIAQQALKEMRLLVYQLRPPALENQGLVAALRQRLEAVEGRAGVETKFVVDVLDRLPAEIEDSLYRIAQEALNNALKHAAATVVAVRLSIEDKQVMLEITDNGHGFDPDAVVGCGGMGLISMRERAEAVGGFLEISSSPEMGTTIKIILER
jgi:signal transduction histidine kinase